MKAGQIILPILAFCTVRGLFWLGGVDLLVRGGDSVFSAMIALFAGLVVYSIVKEEW